MQTQPTVLKLEGFKQKLTINTINLIGTGGKKINEKNNFSIDSKSLGSRATEILSLKRGAAAAAWYTDQSNTSRQIFNSGWEIKLAK